METAETQTLWTFYFKNLQTIMKNKIKNRPGLQHQLVCRETNNYQPFSLNHLPLEKEIKNKDLDPRPILGTLDQKK